MATLFAALFLDEASAQKLAVAGGEPVNELHITLFMGDIDESLVTGAVNHMSGMIRNYEPGQLAGSTTGVGVFTDMTGDSGDAFHCSVNIQNLQAFRGWLVQRFELFGEIWRTYEYNPHITIKYLNHSEPLPYTRAPIIPLTFDKVVFRLKRDGADSFTDANTIEYVIPMNDGATVVNINT